MDTTERFHFHALEKEMATHPSVLAWRIPGTSPWWAAVSGVAQRRTRLMRLSSSSSSSSSSSLFRFNWRMIALRCCFCCAKNELIPSLWSLPRPHPQSQALCASHGPHWLASLHVRGCVWQCQCPSSSHPSYPCPQIPSLHLHLYFCPENRLIGAIF